MGDAKETSGIHTVLASLMAVGVFVALYYSLAYVGPAVAGLVYKLEIIDLPFLADEDGDATVFGQLLLAVLASACSAWCALAWSTKLFHRSRGKGVAATFALTIVAWSGYIGYESSALGSSTFSVFLVLCTGGPALVIAVFFEKP